MRVPILGAAIFVKTVVKNAGSTPLMLTEVFVRSYFPSVHGRVSLGNREAAVPVREKLGQLLDAGEDVVVDFENVEATQSFTDELIGVLVMRRGPSVLKHLQFRKCSRDMRAIVQFVVRDRADHYSNAERQEQALAVH